MNGAAATRRRTGGLRALALLIVGAAAAASPQAASAQWTLFLPRPFENHAFLDTYGSYERDSSSGSARGLRWNDSFFRETLTLESRGYSYDPRFLQYDVSVSGATSQEDYDSSSADGGDWRYGTSLMYDARLFLLPEHAYNLQAFASRYEPLFRQQASNQHGSVAETYGSIFRFRRKPYFVNASFVDTKLNGSGPDSDVKRLGLDGEYFKRFGNGYEFSVNGAFNPSWYSDSDDLDGSSTEYLLSNLINLKKVRLNSSVTQNSFEQSRGPFDGYDTDQFGVWELLSVYLPYSFRTDLAYRHHDDKSTVDGVTPGLDRKYSDDGDNVQLDVIHKLYQSVDTDYRFVHDTRTSSGGETTLTGHGLSLDYAKMVPHGRLTAGFALGRAETENRGFVDVVNEPYTGTAVPGTFTLHQQNVDASSITLLLKSPLPPFETIQLVEGVHYTVNTAVMPFEFQVFALPPEFVVPGSYDFYATYSLLTGDFDLRTDTWGTNTSVQLFGDLVTPFVRYAAIRSSVLSGTFPGTPIDSDSYATGVILHYRVLRVRTEYQYLDWDVNPYRAWRTEAQYVGNPTPTISTYAVLSYMNRHYLGGQSVNYSDDYTEDSVTTSASVTKQLPIQNLYVTLGGSYSHLKGLVESNGWSATSSLVWHIGKVDISVGLSAYGADNTGNVGLSTDRNHELVYVNFRRQLF